LLFGFNQHRNPPPSAVVMVHLLCKNNLTKILAFVKPML
jgi:hypothetical protein